MKITLTKHHFTAMNYIMMDLPDKFFRVQKSSVSYLAENK